MQYEANSGVKMRRELIRFGLGSEEWTKVLLSYWFCGVGGVTGDFFCAVLDRRCRHDVIYSSTNC